MSGFASGYLIVQGVNRVSWNPACLRSLILGLALCVYAATSLVGCSGFLAVYVAGIVMGNMRPSTPKLPLFQNDQEIVSGVRHPIAGGAAGGGGIRTVRIG